MKSPKTPRDRLMRQVAAVAKRKGLPCTITPEEVKWSKRGTLVPDNRAVRKMFKETKRG